MIARQNIHRLKGIRRPPYEIIRSVVIAQIKTVPSNHQYLRRGDQRVGRQPPAVVWEFAVQVGAILDIHFGFWGENRIWDGISS